MKTTGRIFTRQEVIDAGCEDFADLAEIFHHNIGEREDGEICWEPNRIIEFIYVEGDDILNRLWVKSFKLPHVLELMKFYMQIGYTLEGFATVFYQKRSADWDLPDAIQYHTDEDGDSDDPDPENLVGYVLKHFKGKELNI